MPGRGLPAERFGAGVHEVDTDYGGGVRLFAGHGSVATPGAVAACRLAHRAARRAAVGRRRGARARRLPQRLPRRAAPRRRYLAYGRTVFGGTSPTPSGGHGRADGSAVGPGDMVTNPDLADVLDLVASDGASVLYTGEVGRAMVDDMAAQAGWSPPSTSRIPAARAPGRALRLGEWDLAVNPPPSVGGPMLAVMLRRAAAARRLATGRGIIDIQRSVLRYRQRACTTSPPTSSAAGHELLLSVDRHGLPGLPTRSSTANVSVVDRDGTACAITASSGYGAGVTVPGTGLLLNNALGEPELNRLGLHAARAGHAARVEHGAHHRAHAPTGGCSRSAAPAPTGSPPH